MENSQLNMTRVQKGYHIQLCNFDCSYGRCTERCHCWEQSHCFGNENNGVIVSSINKIRYHFIKPAFFEKHRPIFVIHVCLLSHIFNTLGCTKYNGDQ